MATHALNAEPTHSRWNRALPPRLTIESGDTVRMECVDSSGAQVRPGMSVAELREALRRAASALEELTAREIEVLQQVASGNRNKDIAQLLFISEETVKVHIKHIMGKLGARDRTHAITIAVRRGIIQL